MEHVHWVEFLIFLAGEAVTLLLPFWLLPRIFGAPSDTIVRPEKSCVYFGFVCIFQGVLYGAIGIGNVLSQGAGQILPWCGLVFGFGLFGFGLFYWAWKEKITITESGLEFCYMFRRERHVAWPAITQIKKNWLGYIVIKLRPGRSLLVPEAYQNTVALLLAAKDKQIPLLGYDLGGID